MLLIFNIDFATDLMPVNISFPVVTIFSAGNRKPYIPLSGSSIV